MSVFLPRYGGRFMKKMFILDTNVLIHDPLSFTRFEDNIVIIPISVIEELDRFKVHSDERGRAVRIVSRKLDELRSRGRLNEGVKMENGGTLIVELNQENILPKELSFAEMDNRILNNAWHHLKKKHKVVVVSKDINLRLKAEALGLNVQDYTTDKVNIDELYNGFSETEVPAELIDSLYRDKEAKNPVKELAPNEFLILRAHEDAKKTAMARVAYDDVGKIRLLSSNPSPWGIQPRSKEQRFAMELLLDPKVNLVTLLGSAGTGKTIVTLACGLQQSVEQNLYRKLVICRPIVSVGKDIGFLPGSKDEKLATWMGAIYDNLEILMDKKHQDSAAEQMQYLMDNEKIELASVSHIRGRSLPNQYMIVDDAQNLTPHEMKTILSRAGEGTKVVVTGDPYQIDSPYLDVESNGLTYLISRMRGQDIYGHLTFSKTERSRLAGLVAELL